MSKKFPPHWRKVGHVYVDPQDPLSAAGHYPSVIFEEDPNTFSPDLSMLVDEQSTPPPWGLRNDEDEDEEDDIQKVMQRMMIKVNQSRMSNYDSPLIQFVKKLEARKIDISPKTYKQYLSKSFELKVSLVGSEEYCYRVIRVPSAIKLGAFQDQVLTPVMGWCRQYHGYCFQDSKDGSVFGPDGDMRYIDMMHAPMHYDYVASDEEIPLAAFLKEPDDYVFYNYDLGDGWLHCIKLIKVYDNPIAANDIKLLSGKGSCPPEDSCGIEGAGSDGYEDFLADYHANPRSPQVKNAIKSIQQQASNYTRPWSGEPLRYHPLEFDIEYHRRNLQRMVSGPRVSRTSETSVGGGFTEDYSGCHYCGDRFKALQKCGRCKQVQYCGRDCQKKHWKEGHKQVCAPITTEK